MFKMDDVMVRKMTMVTCYHNSSNNNPIIQSNIYTGWECTGQMLCIVDTSLSILMTLRMCLRELCCLFTVWI